MNKKIKIKQMTKEHLENRIAFFERKLKNKPPEQHYIGDSDYAEDAVNQENRNNERMAKDIIKHIKKMKKELVDRLKKSPE